MAPPSAISAGADVQFCQITGPELIKEPPSMHSYLYYPFMGEIDELKIAKIGKFDPDCKSEINNWDIDMGFKRTLQWYWFKSEVCVGPTLYSVKQIVADEKEIGNLKGVGKLLSIGSGPNGDDLLVD